MPKRLDKNRIRELSEKWLNGTISEVEKREFDQWYSSFSDHDVLDITEKELTAIQHKVYRAVIESSSGELTKARRRNARNPVHVSLAAASIILFIISAIYLYGTSTNLSQDVVENSKYISILPGKDRARLTLDNGEVFDLESLSNLQIEQASGMYVEKTKEGELVYSMSDPSAENEAIVMNTVSTPRGGQYKITLPDGSKVWLNAASSLTFPSSFSRHSRTVELKGEAYFEVTARKGLTFKVVTNNEEVEVLGTHFNVNSYQDEDVSMVSLLEGKVKVTASTGDSKLLAPGEQTRLQVESGMLTLHQIDISEAVAWKNGDFMFNNENLKSVMQKIGRWYDIDISIAPELEHISIWGSISRYDNFNKVLEIIKLTDDSIRFEVTGRRVSILK